MLVARYGELPPAFRNRRVHLVNAKTPSRWPRWATAVVAIGALLRLSQFFSRRSLWYDEAALALNILHRSFTGLFHPLEYHQGAPIGFLLLEKFATRLAGESELTLRAVPLLAGIAALFVFYEVAKLYLSPRAVPIAVILFCLSPGLVYHSSEAKQYSTDVLVTVALLYGVFRLSKGPFSTRELLCGGILGAVAIWFSHPSSFVLAGAASVLIAKNVVAGDAHKLRSTIWLLSTWAASFALCYAVSLRLLSSDTALLAYWRGAFPPHSLLEIVPWLTDNFFAAFENPAPLNAVLGAGFFVAGCGQLLRDHRQRSLALLLAPLMVLFLASWLHRYPLQGRLLLFVCPILLLVVSEGAAWAYSIGRRLSPLLAIAVLALLLAKPMYLAADLLIHPTHPDDIKRAIQFVQARQQPIDVWYVYYGAIYQFTYYTELYHLTGRVRNGAECGADPACYAADVAPLRGDGRVWAILSHILIHDGVDEGVVLQNQMDSLGLRLDSYRASGARAYLYDFSSPPKQSPHHE